MIRPLLVCCLALIGAACGEKPQTAGTAVKKSDSSAWVGASNPYVNSGWKAGDRASWEEQIRSRAQAQNEYSRMPAR